MIGRLCGKLVEKELNYLVVDVQGVGYDVSVSLSTSSEVGELGEDVLLHIHTHVREDIFQLFGFGKVQERMLFRLLLTVSGVGPRMALAILSSFTPEELVDVLRRGLHVRLTSVPGVGKRKAERLVVELRDKVVDLDLGWSAEDSAKQQAQDAIKFDLHSALVNMGYKPVQVEQMVKLLQSEIDAGVDIGALVRMAIRKLSQ
ncbi:MAG: Holliday junction branch migration protein RuvA [Myxococcota bacterium]